MNFNPNNFREVNYDNSKIYFDKSYSFHEHFKHKQKTKKFPFYRNILKFLEETTRTKIYFTLNEEVKTFQQIDDGFLLNMPAYLSFCRTIASRTGGRLKAFLGQNVDLLKITATEAEKSDFIKANANEKNILDAIKSLPEDVQLNISESLSTNSTTQIEPSTEISSEEFVTTFVKFLTDKDAQNVIYSNLPKIQIDILKSHKIFLESNLDKDESFIQNWLDEDNGKHRKQRCLIFGIEYVDPKREGEFMRKRFDILAEQNLDNHILIELKSPCAEIFEIKENPNANDGVTTEYHLSRDLARAVPQILGYKKWYESARPEEIQALGIEKRRINKCIIVLGTRKKDVVWKQNFHDLKSSLNIELYTYTDLIDRLVNTIKNLEQSL